MICAFAVLAISICAQCIFAPLACTTKCDCRTFITHTWPCHCTQTSSRCTRVFLNGCAAVCVLVSTICCNQLHASIVNLFLTRTKWKKVATASHSNDSVFHTIYLLTFCLRERRQWFFLCAQGGTRFDPVYACCAHRSIIMRCNKLRALTNTVLVASTQIACFSGRVQTDTATIE